MGRVGTQVAACSPHRQLPFVSSSSTAIVSTRRAQGWPIVYGDGAQPTVLEAAHVATARLVLVTVPAFTVARSIVDRVRQMRPDVAIVARADGFDALDELRELGVEEAIQPELEAGLEMTRMALVHLACPRGHPCSHRPAAPGTLRTPVRLGLQDGRKVSRLAGAIRLLEFRWIEVQPGSVLADASIGEVGLRKQTGASIVGLSHDDHFVANPVPEQRLRAGTLLAVVGSRTRSRQWMRWRRRLAPRARLPDLRAAVHRPPPCDNGRAVVVFGPPEGLVGWKAVERGAPPPGVLSRVRHLAPPPA